MLSMRCVRFFLLALLFTPITCFAESHYYTGNITFLELTGKDCGGISIGDNRAIQVVLATQGKRIEGYSQILDANPGHFSGDSPALILHYPDLAQDARHVLSLLGVGTPSLTGELREKILGSDEEGCNLSRGKVVAQRVASGKEAESHLQELRASFQSTQDEYAAKSREPHAYEEILRIAPDLIRAEADGSENLQQAALLRERLQPLYEKVYGAQHLQTLNNLSLRAKWLERIGLQEGKSPESYLSAALQLRVQLQTRYEKAMGRDSLQSMNNLTARIRLLKRLQHPDQALALSERALKIAEKNFPAQIATVAYNLGDVLDMLQRKKSAVAAFGKAVRADERQYGHDHPEVASDLERRAKLLEELQRQSQAIADYRRILAIRERTPNAREQDIELARNNLARAYDPQAFAMLEQFAAQLQQAKANRNLKQAVDLRQQMLPLAEKSYGKPSKYLANLLFSQADELESLGRDQEALALYPQAMEAVEASYGREHEKTAEMLNNFAYQYEKMGRYQEALPLFQRALEIREKVLGAEHPDTAASVNNLALLYKILGQYPLALPLYQRSLQLSEKILGADHPDTAISLNNLAILYETLGQFEQSLPLKLRALAIKEKALGPNHPSTATSLNNLAILYKTLGLYEQALPLYQRALAIREQVLGAEHADTTNSLNNLATLYMALGEYKLALPLLQRTLSIRERTLGDEHPDVAVTLNSLAGLYDTLGQYDQALPLYQRALAIDEKVFGAEHAETATILNNLASLYDTLGKYDQAMALYQRSLAIREKVFGAEHVDTSVSLNNLALLHDTLQQYDQALPLYQRALEIREKVLGPSHPYTATSLSNLGLLYRARKQYAEELPLIERALKIREKAFGLYHVETAQSLNILATHYALTQQPERALPYFQRAYRSAQSARMPDTLKVVQASLGTFYAVHGNSSAAIFHFKSAVNTMQTIRAGAKGLDKSLQRSLLKKNEELYKKLANLLVAAGRLAEAQQVLAMLKEDEYFDFIRRDAQADVRATRMNYSGAEKPFAEQFDQLGKNGAALVDQLNLLNKQAKLGLTPEQVQQRTHINAQLAEQEQQTLALLNELPQQLSVAQQQQLAQQRIEQTQLAAGVQKQLGQLGSGVTLIQYLLLGDKIQIILTDAHRQIAREAPLGEAALYPKLVALRKALEDPRLDPRPWAQELYQSLIAPIEADIKSSRTLMLSLDGALRYIPFSTLFDGQRYLVERYRLSIYTAAAKDKLTAAANPQWTISGLGVTQAHTGFSALPGVQAELAGIIGKNGTPGETHLDQEFTAEQMQASLKQGNPVLHLASHFQFTPGTEADSYLLLGDGSHLSLKDIRQGDYPFGQLDLLTLSACATAMHGGQEANGKEVEGFGALAQIKGAKGVLATLWPIADTSTAQLMQTLYRSRQQQHLNKAEALRQAQLALLHGNYMSAPVVAAGERGAERLEGGAVPASDAPVFEVNAMAPFAHPYYWAPFILMGNWL